MQQRRIYYFWWMLTVVAGVDWASASEVFIQDIQPFLERHCYSCHGPEKQKSQIRFDQLSDYSLANNRLWTQVHEQLSGGEMPPEKEPRPDPEPLAKVLTWIEQQQQEATRTGIAWHVDNRARADDTVRIGTGSRR